MASTSFRVPNRVQSTAGAVPVINEKGEMRMEKVKVNRYIPGRRPDYAGDTSSSSSSESESEEEEEKGGEGDGEEEEEEIEKTRQLYDEIEILRDRRLRRLIERSGLEDQERDEREDEPEEQEEEEEAVSEVEQEKWYPPPAVDSDQESDEEEIDDEELERRRELMRDRARRRAEEELMDVAEEEQSGSAQEEEDESSEYEEYTDSEDDMGPRLKPVFVRKNDRITIQKQEEVKEQEELLEKELKQQTERRKKESTRLLAQTITMELQKEQGATTIEEVVNTDDENDEEEYEAWKVRELKRIKRDREELEKIQKERQELERVRNMSEEEKKAWLEANPREITNKQTKGKYKFLQKYYHRGVFYLDEEDTVFKRNFSEPTLEDHFDKTVLPKVMQVKNFGRAGRTKYTHLVDQDTTAFDSPWSEVNPINIKFQNKGGGGRQVFTKPSAAKKQKTS